jgi:hypothetical protein
MMIYNILNLNILLFDILDYFRKLARFFIKRLQLAFSMIVAVPKKPYRETRRIVLIAQLEVVTEVGAGEGANFKDVDFEAQR